MAKKIVKPTAREQAEIDKRLAKKYPHMSSKAWVSRLKKSVKKELQKRRGSTEYQLAKAGVSKKKVGHLKGK